MPRATPPQQQSQAEQAIADGAGVILLTSLDTGSGATIIDQAKDAGVAVVEYDRFNTGGSGGDVYVSFDNVAVGAAMAEVMDPDNRRARRGPEACRPAQRRRGGQQLLPLPHGLRGGSRGEGGGRRVGDRRRPVRPRLGQRRGADDHGADPHRREQRRRRGLRGERRSRKRGRSTRSRRPGSRALPSVARTRPRPACRTSFWAGSW